jgi:signal peptidase II
LAATEPQAKAPASKGSGSTVSVRALIALALVAVVAYSLDQFTKLLIVSALAENQQVSAIGELLQFHFVRNSGAAFSIASGSTWIFSIAASAVTIFIIGFARRIRSVGWAVLFGMLLGGTTGNLTDRLFREPGFGVGRVIDFIQVQGFPAIFNIADSFIVASMGLFILLTIRGIGLDGRRASERHAPSGSDDLTGSEPAIDDSADPK